MRKTIAGSLIAILAAAGALAVPSGIAAASSAKVVVIVGPVGSMTASYKADADEIAAAALTYTPDVVKIYTPNATWAAVKSALQGANVVVYLGHGNGFPSPYSTTLQPLNQDGLGLNPIAGANDTTTKYYGESYLASDIHLAANAVVLLHHLCYASGNSEPGRAEPTLAVAQQRVDNFGAGWLQTGARAVIADAHYGSSYYMTALFTTDQTLESAWRGAPGARGNYMSFQSSRTPGAIAEMDPDTATSGFYRSFVGDPSLTTGMVTGGGVVSGATAPVTTTPVTTTPVTTAPLTTLPVPAPATYALPGATGPQVLQLADGGGSFSPNGDGRSDTIQVSGTLSEAASWNVSFATDGGMVLAGTNGSGTAFAATWDGLAGGARVPDGTYRYTITAADQTGPQTARSGTILIDTTPPVLAPATASALAPVTFSPNGDGIADSVATVLSSTDAGFADVAISSVSGQRLRTFSLPLRAGRAVVGWNGLSDAGSVVPDGTYAMTVSPSDGAGNVGPGLARQVSVYTAVSAVRSSLPAFYPQDPNGSAPAATTLSFALATPATITWTISDAAGRTVLTHYATTPLGPGSYSFAWDGRDATGAVVRPGTYYSNVLATDGALTLRTRGPFSVGAFALRASVSTAVRGRTFTLTATSAEPLAGRPVVTIAQTGTSVRRVTMVGSGTSFRLSITLRRTASIGALRLTVVGLDRAGGRNTSALTLPVR